MVQALAVGVVALLIELLGHPSYLVRQRSQAALCVLAPLAAEQLDHAIKTHYDAEVRHRAAVIYRPVREQRIERQAFGLREPLPWLFLEDTWLQDHLIETAKKRWDLSRNGPDWPAFRSATGLWIFGRLMAGVPLADVEAELDTMAQEECRWVAANRRQ